MSLPEDSPFGGEGGVSLDFMDGHFDYVEAGNYVCDEFDKLFDRLDANYGIPICIDGIPTVADIIYLDNSPELTFDEFGQPDEKRSRTTILRSEQKEYLFLHEFHYVVGEAHSSSFEVMYVDKLRRSGATQVQFDRLQKDAIERHLPFPHLQFAFDAIKREGDLHLDMQGLWPTLDIDPDSGLMRNPDVYINLFNLMSGYLTEINEELDESQ